MGSVSETKLYVVTGTMGEYSDRTEWTAGVFTDEDEAKRLVDERLAVARGAAYRNREWKDATIAAESLCHHSIRNEWVMCNLRGQTPPPALVEATAAWRAAKFLVDAAFPRETRNPEADDFYITEVALNVWRARDE